jgi:hypothetical protein
MTSSAASFQVATFRYLILLTLQICYSPFLFSGVLSFEGFDDVSNGSAAQQQFNFKGYMEIELGGLIVTRLG